MAQRMVDEKARAVEEPEVTTPAALVVGNLYNPEEATLSDAETLGSEDTETEEEEEELDQMSTISEEEEEDDSNKENSPPPPLIPLKRRRNTPSSRAAPSRRIRPQPLPDRPPRGNYRSWARYRVAICQALRDTVFDRVKAANVLKTTRQLYVPASVLAYYAKKLLAMTDDSAFTHSCESA